MADFQTWLPDLKSQHITVIAASVDDETIARKTADALKLGYPLAHGLDYQAVSRATGAYIEHERKILHATGFLLKPDLRVQVAAYSSGAIGRLTPNDVSSLARLVMAKESAPPAAPNPQGDRQC